MRDHHGNYPDPIRVVLLIIFPTDMEWQSSMRMLERAEPYL